MNRKIMLLMPLLFLLPLQNCSSRAADEGFVPLFPRDSLEGWNFSDWSNLQKAPLYPPPFWTIQNGILHGVGKRTWIFSDKEYGDFILKFEGKITAGANSGIGLRFPPEGDPAYQGMEIQFVDYGTYYHGRSRPEQRTGSIYDEIAAKPAMKPAGEWNSWEITARGPHIKVVLNGKTVVDVDVSRETQPRQEKGPALAERPIRGRIGFQNLKGEVFLRNIIIKSLDNIGNPGNSVGFKPLFNGKDLSGWVNVNCAPETWTVRDGMIICSGFPTGLLRTDKQYENFILELDWKHLHKGGNSGLYIHSDALTACGQPFSRAIECQIMDGNGGDIFAIHGASLAPARLHPQKWMRALPSENRLNPPGQWNHYRVISRDGTVSLEVNGKIVNRAYHLNPRKGYICLESEGSEIHFRNIRIKELAGSNPPAAVTARKDQGFRSLYNGLDLRGWREVPGNKGHWQAKNWILDYDGKSEASSEDRNLWTEEEFGNFVLIVDWRQTAKQVIDNVPVILPDGDYLLDDAGKQMDIPVWDAGDSGIYVRGTSKCQFNIWNWPVGSGEIWGYRTDKSMPPEVRRAATPILKADNPIGQWNRFEITVVADKVTVVLNGKTVIRQAVLPGMPAKGPIALQHHGDPVQFANIYIKKLD